MEIRRSYDRLISTMGFPILVRRHLYIESGTRAVHEQRSLCKCIDNPPWRHTPTSVIIVFTIYLRLKHWSWLPVSTLAMSA